MASKGQLRKTAQFPPAQIGVDGEVIEPEVSENEEQKVKYGEIIDLLLAAGYFRARISSLSPFDRVIGGLAWCLTNSAVDVDVDVVFIENATIGQKIPLSEKIIRALPKLKCPHRLEPHQIQGLDFINIFPVIQWLVKKVIETREEMSDYVRNFSESQFSKTRQAPEDIAFNERKKDAIYYLSEVRDRYKSTRKYKQQHAPKRQWTTRSNSSRAEQTLLEFGHRFATYTAPTQDNKKESDEKTKAAEEEKRRIDALVEQMKKVDTADGKASSTAVGSLIGMESESIRQLANEYAEMQAELADSQTTKMGGAQSHKREVASLEKQIANQEKKLEVVKEAHDKLLEEFNQYQNALSKTIKYNTKIIKESAKLDELETEENAPILKILRALLATTDALEEHERQFKENCKKQFEDLKAKIKAIETVDGENEGDSARIREIQEQFDAEYKKLQKTKKIVSKKKREISMVERLIDEIPSRTELGQYQKRFLELYNQVASKLTETRQYYNLFNTLNSTKDIMSKEVSLLNSIYENFTKAKGSKNNQDKFIESLDNMNNQVKEILKKTQAKNETTKKSRDVFNEKYLELLEQQRTYIKTVLDFQEECAKNERLSSELTRDRKSVV